MIRVAILGSTGSIGRSTLEVIDRHSDRFRVVALTAHNSIDVLFEQEVRFRPETVVLSDETVIHEVHSEWRVGRDALVELCSRDDVDIVVNALIGAAGLEPTLAALRAGKRVALANKESLVAAGELVLEAAREGGGELVPIDSEHSAILQCIEGSDREEIRRIVITASGGPFRGSSRAELDGVGPADALNHPTWDMGSRISVDSATMANKALEVIEAHHLYDLPYDRIEAVVHPQSVIHSFVEFVDGSLLAQLGFPTMELPILYALTYPKRVADTTLQTFDPVTASPLTFERIDESVFPMFGLGVEAGRTGGVAPAVFNAAKEIAVDAFLEGNLSFYGMSEIVDAVLEEIPASPIGELQDVLDADTRARGLAEQRILTAART